MLHNPLEDRLDAHPRLGAHAQDLVLGTIEEFGQLSYGCFAAAVVFYQVPFVDCRGELAAREKRGEGRTGADDFEAAFARFFEYAESLGLDALVEAALGRRLGVGEYCVPELRLRGVVRLGRGGGTAGARRRSRRGLGCRAS